MQEKPPVVIVNWSQLPDDIFILILSMLTRAELKWIAPVSKKIKRFTSTLIHDLTPEECCRIINETICKINSVKNKELNPAEQVAIKPIVHRITKENLKQYWPGTDEEFLQLCSIRSFDYLSAPVTKERTEFVLRIVRLTQVALGNWNNSFLRNFYLFDLVFLLLLIEVYVRKNNFEITVIAQKQIKLSDMIFTLRPEEYPHRFQNKPDGMITYILQNSIDPARCWLQLYYVTVQRLVHERSMNTFLQDTFIGKLAPEILPMLPQNSNEPLNHFIPVAIALYVNPHVVLKLFPKLVVHEQKVGHPNGCVHYNSDVLLKLARMPDYFFDKMVRLPLDTVKLLTISGACQKNYPQTFFKRVSTLSSLSEAEFYKQALDALASRKESAALHELEALLNVPLEEVTAKIKLAQQAPKTNSEVWRQTAPLYLGLLLKHSQEELRNMVVPLLFGKKSVYLRETVGELYSLSLPAINFLIELKKTSDSWKYLEGLKVSSLRKEIEILKNHHTQNLLFVLRAEYISIQALSSLYETQLQLFETLLSVMPQENLTKENTQQLMSYSQERDYQKERKFFAKQASFFPKFFQGLHPTGAQLFDLLNSPILEEVMECPAYIKLGCSVGMAKLLSCHQNVQIEGIQFKVYVTKLYDTSINDFNNVAQLIKQACDENREAELPAFINNYFKTGVTKLPEVRKRSVPENDNDKKWQQLKKLMSKVEKEKNADLRNILLNAGIDFLGKHGRVIDSDEEDSHKSVKTDSVLQT